MALRASLFLALLVALACTTTPVPTPALTDAPDPTDPRPTANATTAPDPTLSVDATLVLRMSSAGGLRYPGATVEPPPEFSLYSDGHVIWSRSTGNDEATTVEIGHARMTADQVTTILQDAMGNGALGVARSYYENGLIADAGTVTFELHADGVDKRVSVYALGFDEGVPAADLAVRQSLAALAQRLLSAELDAAAGRIRDLGTYEPEAYLLTLDQPIHDDAVTPRPWPWDDLDPSFFEGTNSGDRTRVISPQQARLFWETPMSVPLDQVLSSPDGASRYLVRIRPLLPDQI